MRQIVLDTETTGLDTQQGHRIIEIGCVELVSRRPTGNDFHQYLNPEREIDAGAAEVHGITLADLAGKPRFSDIAPELVKYLAGAEVIIHNAPFDVGFLDHEFHHCGLSERIASLCTVVDTLTLAREIHPGQRNSLDALCKRYAVDNTGRDLHGALLDARLLADVYLAMTGGQVALSFDQPAESTGGAVANAVPDPAAQGTHRVTSRARLTVVRPTAVELEAHERRLDEIEKSSGAVVWRQIEPV
ncbi:MAG: DNA polymerase III subunit epsilon [Chromatiales bacterium]|nr:DNA polymerase III subunit epsilon [Chromatiales bacterium]